MPDNASLSPTLLHTGPGLWMLLAVLLVLAAVLGRGALGTPLRQVFTAALRALVQLAVVALVISRLGGSPVLAGAFLLLMLAVAAWTVTRRLGGSLVGAGFNLGLSMVCILAGVLPVAALLLATGVLPLNALALIAVLGQLIGGAMTAANLAGRRLAAELRQRRGEVEAGLALGLSDRAARALVYRPVAGEALIPALDQTRTVGTVTLPGAFVGLILGGADPLSAGLVQLLVLISLLAVEALAITAVVRVGEGGRL